MSTPVPARRDHAVSIRAFALNPLVMFVFVLIVAILAWKTTIQLGLIPSNYPFAAKTRSKIITMNVVTALVVLALAGGIGAARYFTSGRSERAASSSMLVVMVMFLAVFGYQMVNYLINGPTARASQTAQAGGGSSAAPSEDPAVRGLQRIQDQLQRQNDRLTQPRTIPTPPINPTEPARANPRPVQPSPAPTPSGQPSAPARPAPSGVSPVEETSPAATRALDELTGEIDKQTADLVTLAEGVYAQAGKLPARSIPELEKRAKAAESLAASAKQLAERLRTADDQARQKLAGAGISDSDAVHLAMRYAMDKRYSLRAMSAESLARFAAKVQEEAEYLRDNFGRWSYDSKGVLTSKDAALKGRAGSLRTQVEWGDRDKTDTLDGLKGR